PLHSLPSFPTRRSSDLVAKFIAKVDVASPDIANPVAYPLMQWPGMLPLLAAQKHHEVLERHYEAMLSRNKSPREDRYRGAALNRSEEHTSELQSRENLV